MSGFEPGPNWREVSSAEYTAFRGHRLRVDSYPDDNGLSRYWVAADPVPPLPVEPWTVIRVEWRAAPTRQLMGSVLLLDGDNLCWRDDEGAVAAPDLTARITGFEVLAEPRTEGARYWTAEQLSAVFDAHRRETAKAVLDRIRDSGMEHPAILEDVAAEFGVTQ